MRGLNYLIEKDRKRWFLSILKYQEISGNIWKYSQDRGTFLAIILDKALYFL